MYGILTKEISYTEARAHFAATLDQVSDNQDIVIVKRRNHKGVALIAEEELASLLETAHLLRSPRNAARLLRALERAKAGTTPAMTIEQLKQEVGIGQEENP